MIKARALPQLRRYARGLVVDTGHADDLVQDTLKRAWSRFGLWQRRGDLRAWMVLQCSGNGRGFFPSKPSGKP